MHIAPETLGETLPSIRVGSVYRLASR